MTLYLVVNLLRLIMFYAAIGHLEGALFSRSGVNISVLSLSTKCSRCFYEVYVDKFVLVIGAAYMIHVPPLKYF